jgi:hypothetical protein
MKIGEFLDSCLRLLSSFEYSKSESLFERRDVKNILNDAIGAVVEANFFKEYGIGELGVVDAGFIQTFEVPVLFSTTRNKYYSILPNLPIALPSGLGLFEVTPIEDQSAAFIPLQQGSAGLYKGLESENLFGEAGYRQEGIRIWYQGGKFKGQISPMVLMNIICDTSNLTLDDNLPVPSNYIGQLRSTVIGIMTQGLQIPADTSNNATPDNRKK